MRDGFHPVIIGKRDHVEVRGLTEDLAECDIVLTEADVAALRERPRFGVAAQTTQPIARVRQLVADDLGLDDELVFVGATNTDKNNNTSPTAASTSMGLATWCGG